MIKRILVIFVLLLSAPIMLHASTITFPTSNNTFTENGHNFTVTGQGYVWNTDYRSASYCALCNTTSGSIIITKTSGNTFQLNNLWIKGAWDGFLLVVKGFNGSTQRYAKSISASSSYALTTLAGWTGINKITITAVSNGFFAVDDIDYTVQNLSPTNITLSNSSLTNGSASSTVVGTFSTTDSEDPVGHTYTFASGGTDNGSFTISGTSLQTAFIANYEIKSSYTIKIRSTDTGGLYYEKYFTITIMPPVVIYVDQAASGSNSGTSWANAYTSLQSALNAAVSEEQIWVAKGTYKPSSAYDLTNTSRYYHFRMKDGVTIYGGFAGTEAVKSQRTDFAVGGTNETILSGDIGVPDDNSDNCYHIFYHPDSYGLTSSAILNGFTIKYGYADGTGTELRGGGMHNGTENNPTIDQCSFLNNFATYGGGIYNITCSPTISNCLFSANTATQWGGGIYNTTNAQTQIVNCLIINNHSNTTGGGIYNYDVDGLHPCNVVITNTTVANNSAGYCGGVRIYFCTVTLNNCIVWGNTHTSSTYGSQISVGAASKITTINNSCYSNNTSDIFGSPVTSNCITTDPQFAETSNNDFRISGNSPCKNTGDNSYNTQTYDMRGQLRIQNTIDMGAYEWTSGVDPEAPLPVELTSFNASVNKNNITLQWNTATELSNYGFDVLRQIHTSTPLSVTNWEKIGFVNGHGNSNSPKEYSFVDDKVSAGKYSYRLKQIDNNGQFEYSKIVEVSFMKPNEFELSQNYPNPFNPSTTIRFNLPEASLVKLTIFNILGQEIRTLVNEFKESGVNTINFDASGLNSGMYIYKIEAGNFIQTRKMTLLK